MSRFIFALLVVGSGFTPVRAAENVPGGDLARFQGRWVAKAGAERKLNVTLDVEGCRIKVKVTTPQGVTLRARGELSLDETTSPRTLDWIKLTGPDGSVLPEILAIYEFHGDSFRLCNGGPNNARPKAFAAGEGPLADVLKFERPVAVAARP